MKKFNRILSALLAVMMMLSCAVLSGAANITFTDVSGHWAWTNGQIPYLVDKGVLNGYKNETNGTYYFKPDGEVTRAEFIKMLDETFGLTATGAISYEDIKSSDWYYTYFAKAAAQGYLINYGSKASPNAKISRQEATALMVRYLDLPSATDTKTSAIADYSEISEFFNDYILRAIDAGIINGYNENGKMYFKPAKTLTRAEALTILYRAAGCIYNNSAYTRDDSAYSSNNTVTRGGITVNNVTMEGRNIITEGASDGTVTFNKCTIKGTLYIRGGANVTFDNCKVENVVALGGGKISVVSGTEIENLTVEATCDISVLSNTEVDTLVVKNGCNNVSVTGNGFIKSAYIYADGFTSAMLPEEFEIGNNLSASFAGTVYSGSSDTQNSFSIDPFVTTDGSYYYINLEASAGGTLYYYYTNNATVPSISNFYSYWSNSSASSSADIKSGESVSIKTYSSSSVKDYSYVVLQLQDGAKKYPVVLIDNSVAASTNGFQTEPYLSDSTTVKFKSSVSGTVMWYYAEDGTNLTQLQFLAGYDKQSSALKGEVTTNTLSTGSVALKESYLKNYSYVAFMIKSSTGTYYIPVVLPLGDNGFDELPTVKTAGVITFKPNVSGDLYYYYAENANLPTPDNFKSEYNAAKYSERTTVKRNTSAELKYETRYITDYPYMILAIKNSDGDYMQPVAVDIDLTTGFKSAPELDDATTIRFKTEDYGVVYYYYTKEKTAPTVDDFTKNYEDAQTKYKGSVKCGTSYAYIEFKSSYTETYPYMAIRFTDEDGKNYSPVLVELDASVDTGFVTLPYAQGGKIYFSTEEDGEVLYFYSRDDSNVPADEFLEWYKDTKSTRRGSVDTTRRTLASFTVDEDILESYPYIILAFREDGDDDDEFYTPYVLDVEQSEMTQAGSGMKVSGPDSYGDIKVTALYDGKLYYYRTDKANQLPSSTRSFEDMYDSASSGSAKNIDKDKSTYIETEDYKYVVLCLKVDGEFLSPVTVNTADGSTGGSTFDDDHDKSGYGIDTSEIYYSKNFDKVSITPEHDGTLNLLIVENGSVIRSSSYSCTEDKACQISLPFSGMSDIISIIVGSGTEFYVQLTDTRGNKYEALKLDLLID